MRTGQEEALQQATPAATTLVRQVTSLLGTGLHKTPNAEAGSRGSSTGRQVGLATLTTLLLGLSGWTMPSFPTACLGGRVPTEGLWRALSEVQ